MADLLPAKKKIEAPAVIPMDKAGNSIGTEAAPVIIQLPAAFAARFITAIESIAASMELEANLRAEAE